MRLLVTALALAALTLAACSHEKALKETPQQIAQEQAAADAHNAGTTPAPGDDETPSTDAPLTTTTTRPAYEGTNLLHVGDCVDLPTTRTASVKPIRCDRPHHAEVTARVDVAERFTNGAPTDADYDRILASDCQRAFDAYVRPPLPPGVDVGILFTTPEAWYLGQHDVICTAEADHEGDALTGSVRKPA